MTTTATPLNTPMLRSQTSSVLVPTWISTLGGGAATAINHTTALSATSLLLANNGSTLLQGWREPIGAKLRSTFS